MRRSTIEILLLGLAGVACGDKGGSTTDGTVTGASTGSTDATGSTGTTVEGVTEVMPSTGSTGDTTTGDLSTGTGDEPTAGLTGTTTDATTGETPGDPAIEVKCRDNLAGASDLYADACVCFVEAGFYPDQATCLAATQIDQATIDCVCPIYAEYPESDALFDCSAALQEDYRACVLASECDLEAVDMCSQTFIAGTQQCQQPPPALNDEIMKCEEMP